MTKKIMKKFKLIRYEFIRRIMLLNREEKRE